MVSLDTTTSLAPAGFKENDGSSWQEVLEAIRMLTNLNPPATVLDRSTRPRLTAEAWPCRLVATDHSTARRTAR